MAEKTPGKSRNTSRKKETEQKPQKPSMVTPIDQAGAGQSQADPLSGSRQSRPVSGSGDSAGSVPNPASRQTGAHPTADQSGASTPARANQSGRHSVGSRLSGQELQERIRARAYELFERRGRREGYHEQDWAQAEAEVLREFEREKSA